jgi:hypothetical protein
MAARRATMVGLVAVMAAAGAPAQAANIFEELGRAIFGGGQRLRATPIYEYDEPQQRLPKAQAPEVSSKPKPPVVQLDPSSDPSWYLKDPTLRRGDIVVTAQGVMVYQGGRGGDGRRSDFTALSAGKDSKGWKQQLETAAAGGRSFFDGATAPPKPAITAQAEAKAP